jgi:hypothetical protein
MHGKKVITGKSTFTSTNYLSGQQIIEKRQLNQRLDKYITSNKQRKSIEKKQMPIEDVDYEK